MQFDFEPSGVNDTYLRIARQGAACILGPGGHWNGLLRLNYVIAGNPNGAEPYLVFRALDVGYDDGRFFWKGRATPVLATSAMIDILVDRGLVDDGEAERLMLGGAGGTEGPSGDEALMLRATIAGATFAPIYSERSLWRSEPPEVTGYALRTMADPGAFMLQSRHGVPVLTSEARAALVRQTDGAAPR